MNNAVYTNFYMRTTTAAIGTGDTTIVVDDATDLPTLTDGDYMYIVLVRVADNEREIVKITAINTLTLTVDRAQEGTTALEFVIGDGVLNYLTKGTLDDKRHRSADIKYTTGVYVIVAEDNGKVLRVDNAFSIPDALPIGFQCEIYNLSASNNSMTATGGVRTLQGMEGGTALAAYARAHIIVIDATTVSMTGLTA